MEAAEWVARRMNADAFDSTGFDAWVAGDPRRQPVFDAMWNRIMGPEMDRALSMGHHRRQKGATGMPVGGMLAGGVLAVLLLAGGYQMMPAAQLFLTSPQTYAAPTDTMSELQLDDGSVITLAGGAEIAVRQTGHDRDLVLKRGTIFAHVAPDKDRPFRIEAGDGEVTVLGTRFEVSLKPSVVRVTVEQGHVRFGRNRWFGTSVDLTAAQAAALTGDRIDRQMNPIPQGGTARWRSEWVEYDNASLRQVVADLESLSPVPIHIRDEGLARQRISGRIRLTDPLRQIDNLSAIHGFAVRNNGQEILISGK